MEFFSDAYIHIYMYIKFHIYIKSQEILKQRTNYSRLCLPRYLSSPISLHHVTERIYVFVRGTIRIQYIVTAWHLCRLEIRIYVLRVCWSLITKCCGTRHEIQSLLRCINLRSHVFDMFAIYCNTVTTLSIKTWIYNIPVSHCKFLQFSLLINVILYYLMISLFVLFVLFWSI